VMAAYGPTQPTWAVQQVGSYLGYTGRGAGVVAKAAFDPNRPFGQAAGCRHHQHNRVAKGAYSTTWSARPSSVIGKVSPSALAVIMLIVSSIRVACCTGRSAGFSPFRMRPTYAPARRDASAKLGRSP
jgi:hypothetical protein